jgi:transposase
LRGTAEEELAMEALYSRCCGLDVHKSSVSACVLLREGGRTQKKYGRYGAMTRDLEELARWLQELGVAYVAMESTGVYWKPVWNILEDQFHLLLVNAQHVKNVPGRKTDVKDSEWIAELLQHGLLRPSFVPEVQIRDLRDLTRSRASLAEETSRIVSRIQKVLEDANVKLASVATNTVGKSGQAMLDALVAGEDDAEKLAHLALGHLRAKISQLRPALEGKVRNHHRFLIQRLMLQWRFISERSLFWISGWSRSGCRNPAWQRLLLAGLRYRASTVWRPGVLWPKWATTWLSSPVLRIWRAGRAYVRATTRVPERDWEAPCVKAALGCAA